MHGCCSLNCETALPCGAVHASGVASSALISCKHATHKDNAPVAYNQAQTDLLRCLMTALLSLSTRSCKLASGEFEFSSIDRELLAIASFHVSQAQLIPRGKRTLGPYVFSKSPEPLRHFAIPPFSSQLRVHTTNERKASMLARPIWTWFNRSSLDPQRDSCAREKVEIVVEEKCKIMHRRWRTWWVNCFIGIDYFGNKMGFVLSDILFGLGVV